MVISVRKSINNQGQGNKLLTGNDELIRMPRPRIDESLLGFVVTLTEANGYDHPRWIMALCDDLNIIKNSDCRTESSPGCTSIADIRRLSQITGVSVSVLNRMRINGSDKNIVNRNEGEIYGNKLARYYVNQGAYKVCPECLREGNYIRKIWHLKTLTACPIHNQLLLDRCPKCGRGFTYNRGKVSECLCRYELRNTAAVVLDEQEVALSRHIYECCGLMQSSKGLSADNPIDSCDLNGLLCIVGLLSWQLYNPTESYKKWINISRPVSEMNEILNRGYYSLQNWPSNYYAFLDAIRENSKYQNKNMGIIQELGKLYSWPHQRMKEHKYDFLRHALERYVKDKWESGYFREGDFSKIKLPYAGFVDMKHAAMKLKTKSKTVRNLINAGMIQGYLASGRLKSRSFVNESSLENYWAKCKESLTLKEAAKLLGTYRVNVVDLAENKSLRALRGPTVDGGAIWAFEKKAVDELIDKLNGTVKTDLESVNYCADKQLSFQRAIIRLGKVRCKTADFVALILGGEISPSGRTNCVGLQSLVFNKGDIEALLEKKKLNDQKEEFLNTTDAANCLQLGHDVAIYDLIDNGYLKAQRMQIYHNPGLRIKRDDLETFMAKYISLSEISKAINNHSARIMSKMLSNGIWPISGQAIDGVRAIFFLRSDVNIDRLKTELTRRSKRTIAELTKNLKYLNYSQAAYLMRMTHSKLKHLIKTNSISPAWKSARESQRRNAQYFAIDDILKYKSKHEKKLMKSRLR